MALSDDEEMQLIFRAQQGDPVAIAEVIDRYQNLVETTARKFLGAGLTLQDMTQEGALWLLIALKKYHPEKLSPCVYFRNQLEWYFPLYKSKWLGLRDEARKRWKKVRSVAAKLEQERRREATPQEVAERSGLRLDIVEEVMAAQRGNEIGFPEEGEELLRLHGENGSHSLASPVEEHLVFGEHIQERFRPILAELGEAVAGKFLVLSILRESDTYGYSWQEIVTRLTDPNTPPPNWSATLVIDFPHMSLPAAEWSDIYRWFQTLPPELSPAALRQWYSRQRRGLKSLATPD